MLRHHVIAIDRTLIREIISLRHIAWHILVSNRLVWVWWILNMISALCNFHISSFPTKEPSFVSTGCQSSFFPCVSSFFKQPIPLSPNRRLETLVAININFGWSWSWELVHVSNQIFNWFLHDVIEPSDFIIYWILVVVSCGRVRPIGDRPLYRWFATGCGASLSFVLFNHFQGISTCILFSRLILTGYQLLIIEVLHWFCESWILLTSSTSNRNASSDWQGIS